MASWLRNMEDHGCFECRKNNLTFCWRLESAGHYWNNISRYCIQIPETGVKKPSTIEPSTTNINATCLISGNKITSAFTDVVHPKFGIIRCRGSLVMMISTWRKMSCKKNAAGATLAATKDWKYWMSWYQFNLLIWKLRFRIQTTSREDSQRFCFVRFLFMRNEPFKIAETVTTPHPKPPKH